MVSLLLWIMMPQYDRPAAVTALPVGSVPLDLQFGDAIWLHGVRFVKIQLTRTMPWR